MLWQLLKEIIFPKFCVGCGQPFTFLCPNCFEKVEFFSISQQPKLDQLYLDELMSACYFYPPITNLIKILKYQNIPDIGITCARLLYNTTNFPLTSCVTAVPLHPQRLQERGFNQAEIIGKELAKLINRPYFNLLKRDKSVPHQAAIENKVLRKINVQNIFSLNYNFDQITLEKNNIISVLIIDDVTTTGSTLNECAKVLKAHGVNQVYGLTIAHGS
jgi:ComF family protein